MFGKQSSPGLSLDKLTGESSGDGGGIGSGSSFLHQLALSHMH